MAVKYVKDFAYDSGFGFTGSSGKMPVKSHMRSPMKKRIGGGVKAGPKAPSIAPAMVEKRSQGLGGLAPETKKLAAYDKPHMAGKKGAKVAQYAKGGAVKGKKKMPSFLKAKMMKKADGGEIDPGLVPQAPPDDYLTRQSGPEVFRWSDGTYHYQPEMTGQRTPLSALSANYQRLSQEALDRAREGMGETRGGPGVAISPLNRAAAITAARNTAMRPNADLMRRAGQEMAARRPMPTRRAMPVAPKAPMIAGRRPMPKTREDTVRTPREMMMQRGPRGMVNRLREQIARPVPRDAGPQPIMGLGEPIDLNKQYGPPREAMPVPYMPTYTAPTREESEEYMRRMGIVPSPEGRYAKGGAVKKGQAKIGKVMGEFKRGELHSGSKKGPVVTNPKQAKAIALSEARAAGAKIPKKAMGGKACG